MSLATMTSGLPEMKVGRGLLAGLTAILLSHPAMALLPPSLPERAAFRKAVDDYQTFVIAYCAPHLVDAYVAARADRDRAFVASLRDTILAADYRQAVAERAELDRHTARECWPLTSVPGARRPAPAAEQRNIEQDQLAEHFAGGDRRFNAMLRLRDALIGPP